MNGINRAYRIKSLLNTFRTFSLFSLLNLFLTNFMFCSFSLKKLFRIKSSFRTFSLFRKNFTESIFFQLHILPIYPHTVIYNQNYIWWGIVHRKDQKANKRSWRNTPSQTVFAKTDNPPSPNTTPIPQQCQLCQNPLRTLILPSSIKFILSIFLLHFTFFSLGRSAIKYQRH